MIIWRFIRGILVSIGLVVVVLAVMGAWGLYQATPKLPQQFVLGYTFNGTPQDKPAPPAWVASFLPVEPRLAHVTDTIVRAGRDSRVDALVVRLGAGQYDWAGVQELRGAIAAFKASGKKAYVFAEGYGDLMPGMAEYYLASVFDEIWIQPVGTVAITGFHAESPYFKAVLERIGVNAQMFQRGAYKTAPEPILRDSMSPEQRETLHAVLSSQMTDFFEGVSESRGLEPAQIGMLIDGAPYTAEEAHDRRLVDTVGYMDALVNYVRDVHKDAEAIVNMDMYTAAMANHMPPMGKKHNAAHKAVALVHVNGMIVSEDVYGGMFSEPIAAAVDIAAQIEAAAHDDNVGAIVVRVNSPGGSPSASETLRRAIENARDLGKYVVVSMGQVAASGGYWVAVDADRIYALPGTLTGSIGVFGGKMDLSGLWDNLDVRWDSVKLGANAGVWSPNAPYDADGSIAVERMMDDIYDSFVTRVAKGRGFSEDVVEKMAQGRVWTGRQAQERGLVDALGGLHEALDHVATELGADDRFGIEIYEAPDTRNPLQAISGFFAGAKAAVAPVYGAFVRAHNPALGLVYNDLGR